MFEKIVIGKLVIGLAVAVFGLLLVSWKRFYVISSRRFLIEALALMTATRVAAFVAMYVVLHQSPQSDIKQYYDWARPILDGKLPYRDIDTAYAPLFTHLSALPLLIFDDARSMIVNSFVFEILSLPVWLAVGIRTLGTRVARTATLLTIGSAVAWWCSGVSGVNQSWMTLFIGLGALFLVRAQPITSAWTFGLTVVAVKFIGLLYTPAFFFSAGRGRWRWAITFVLLVAAVYGGFSLIGNVFSPFRMMGIEWSSANVPFLFSALGLPIAGEEPTTIIKIVSLIGMSIVGLVVLAALAKGAGKRPGDVVPWVALLTLLMMIVSRKSHVWYLAMVTFPVCASAVAYGGKYWAAIVLGVLGAIALPESSLYFRTMQATHVDLRALSAGRADANFFNYLIVLAMDLTQVACYIALAWASWRVLTSGPPGNAAVVAAQPVPRPPSLVAADA